MTQFRVHRSVNQPGVTVWGGSNYYVRARWAIDPALLTVPPGGALTGDNYTESPAIYVNYEPIATNPVVLRPSIVWWSAIKDLHRNVHVAIEWTSDASSGWNAFDAHTFIINHDPEANAGSDQRIELAPDGTAVTDIALDASGSDDPDLHEPVNPDPGPLQYDWWPDETPLAINAGGLIWNLAYGLSHDEQPVFIPAGTFVPFSDRGAYTFHLWVKDNDIADLGAYAGQRGINGTQTRVLIGVGGPRLTIESPTTASPYFGNNTDGVDIRIYYSIGDEIASSPEYDGAWVLRCTITQNEVSPIWPFGAAGDVVLETTKVSFQRVNYIHWNGRATSGISAGGAVAGSFDIRLELLDRNWQATGYDGSVVTMTNAIAIDFDRWVLPVKMSWADAKLSGTFMESGHAGTMGTRLHTGIDIVGGGNPDVTAARSGFYTLVGGGANTMRLTHPIPHRTEYLHCDTLEGHAAGTLVLQGQRLGRMSNAGVPSTHLHFEYHNSPPGVALNPLSIISLRDECRPQIDEVSIRAAAAAGQPANLNNSQANINGNADIIVRCRDRAHPNRDTAMDNGPYSVRVNEINGVAAWPLGVQCDAVAAGDHLRNYFALQSAYGATLNSINHYLPYLRWNTAPYSRNSSPLELDVIVADFYGQARTLRVTLGPEVVLSTAPANPATTSAAPDSFTLQIQITNRTAALNGPAADNYHIELSGPPAGWTVSPTRRSIPNGGSVTVVLTIDPHGAAAQGTHNFELVVSSNILRQVGTRIPLSVNVAP